MGIDYDKLMAAMEADLADVEAERKRAVAMLVATGAAGVAVVAGLGWAIATGALVELPKGVLQLGWVVLALPLAVMLWLALGAQQRFASRYKRLVIGRLVKRLGGGLRYDPDGHVPAQAFAASMYAPGHCDHLAGEDLIEGEVAGRHRCISELHVECGHGKSRHTVFKGLFAEMPLEPALPGHVVLVPDRAERMFGGLGRFFQQLSRSRGTLVRIEDEAFERLFAVYASDERLAHRFLTPALRAKLVDLATKTCPHGLGVSFVDGMAYVAVSRAEDLFEPSLWNPVHDPKPLKGFARDLRSVIGLLMELGLEERAGGPAAKRA